MENGDKLEESKESCRVNRRQLLGGAAALSALAVSQAASAGVHTGSDV